MTRSEKQELELAFKRAKKNERERTIAQCNQQWFKILNGHLVRYKKLHQQATQSHRPHEAMQYQLVIQVLSSIITNQLAKRKTSRR